MKFVRMMLRNLAPATQKCYRFLFTCVDWLYFFGKELFFFLSMIQNIYKQGKVMQWF
jgi:hypothetical protein